MNTIVISSNTCWSIYNFRLDLIKFLSKDYRVEIIAPRDEYSDKLKAFGFTLHDIPMNPSGISPLKDIITIIKYHELFKRIQPDYYLAFTAKPNIYGGYIAAKFGCKVLNNIAGLGRGFSHSGLLQKTMRFLYKYSIKKSHHVFFQNSDDKKLFEELELLKEQNHSVIPGSGVNLSKFHPNRTVDNEPSSTERFVFLFSARLLLEKGIVEYIEAARKIKSIYPKCIFRVLGKYTETASEVSREYFFSACSDGVIEYIGTTDNVANVLQSADCFVLPSYYREGVPRSLLEAGSCGMPLITTNSVGCRETVIDGKNGFLVTPRDIEDLFNKMKMMVELSNEKRTQMASYSRNYMVHHFDENIVFEKYREALRVLS